SNLLYRGFLIRSRHNAQKGCRLEVGDTAGWKPALRDPRQNTSPKLRPATLSLLRPRTVALHPRCSEAPPNLVTTRAGLSGVGILRRVRLAMAALANVAIHGSQF